MKITYSKKGQQMIPNLMIPDQPKEEIGKYGRMRKAFLKEYRKGTYNSLLLDGKLAGHLIEIDRKAREIVKTMIEAEKLKNGLTEKLKAADPMRWTGLMNNLKQAAEGTVLHDLIYI